jgi:hypothetical protein
MKGLCRFVALSDRLGFCLPTVAFGEQRKCAALCLRLAVTPLTHNRHANNQQI